MPKILSKMLSGISQIFYPLCSFSVLLLCLHCVSNLLQFSWNILISECFIHYKAPALFIRENRSKEYYVQFPLTALLGSINLFYIYMELSSIVLKYPPNIMLAYHSSLLCFLSCWNI